MPLDTFSVGTKIKKISAQYYFIVETNIADAGILDSNITVFARAKGEPLRLKYDEYVMCFYKSTAELNVKTVSEYPNNLRYKAFYEIKPISTYQWDDGKLSAVEKNF